MRRDCSVEDAEMGLSSKLQHWHCRDQKTNAVTIAHSLRWAASGFKAG
jgi:hypothetical protein